ncbi:Xylulose kinase [Aquamicrobium terrae]
MALVAGIDLGTSSVRGRVYDERGRQLAEAVRPFATSIPRPGWSEQDPDQWLAGVKDVLSELGDIDALAICGLINTHVLVDPEGETLGSAITWADIRAAEISQEHPAWAPSTAQAKFLWFKKHEPEVLARARWMMLPKDYINYKLTGVIASDYQSARGLVIGERYLTNLPEGLREMLPELLHPDTVIGRKPTVVVGTMDSVAGYYGSGPLDLGTAFNVSGTSDVTGLISSRSVITPGFRSAFPVNTGFIHGGPSSSGGAVFKWATEVFLGGRSFAEVEALARRSTHAHPPIFMPYPNGERAPIWDSSLRSTWLDLTSDHGLPELCLSVLEGLAFAVEIGLSALDRHAPETDPKGPLILSGGGSNNVLLNQLKAALSNRQTLRTLDPQTGVRGAAILAYTAHATNCDLSDASRVLASDTEPVTVDLVDTAIVRQRFERFEDALAVLTPWHDEVRRGH